MKDIDLRHVLLRRRLLWLLMVKETHILLRRREPLSRTLMP